MKASVVLSLALIAVVCYLSVASADPEPSRGWGWPRPSGWGWPRKYLSFSIPIPRLPRLPKVHINAGFKVSSGHGHGWGWGW